MRKEKIIYALIAFVLVPFSICFAGQEIENQYPYIQFLGAAQSIGGSAILVDTGKTRLLVDYGLYYEKDDQQKNQVVLDNPAKLDFVLLTHAPISITQAGCPCSIRTASKARLSVLTLRRTSPAACWI